MDSNSNAIELENISVVYGQGTAIEKKALDNISVAFPASKVIGLIGHTGSGKSTLAMLLNGLNKPTSGKVRLFGKDIWSEPKKIKDVRFEVGIVFQYPEAQLFEETVYKDIAFGPRNMKLPDEEIKKRVYEASEFCGIDEETLNKSPFELSGGQKRRAAIAGVIAMSPKVIVLDEPAAGLDPAGRDSILGGLLEYRKKHDATMIIISHSMEDIAKYADLILVLKDGRVYTYGTVDEIFSNAEKLFDASLDLPQITKLFIELEKRGLCTETNCFTVEKASERILSKC